MKTYPISLVGAFLLAFFCNYTQAQSIGTVASAVWISDCNQSNFYNTSGSGANEIGPSANVFDNSNLGVHTQNSGTLILRGAQLKTFKDPATSNVCSARMFYRVYLQSAAPGAFLAIDLPLLEDCNGPAGVYPSGGPCTTGDQKWYRVIPDGTTTPYAPINLTSHTPGTYVVEVYYDISGSQTTTTLCNDNVVLNNSGNNYKATFRIQAPTISSTNPSSCNGTEGSITISGLAAGASYDLTYTDDGAAVGPIAVVANGSGQISITGLNAGLYANFNLTINGCTTSLFTGVILSNPIFVPTFTPISPFCAGTTAPVLPTISNNGVNGTWNPSVISNTASGTYTFTPQAGQCGITVTLNVTIIQRTVPTFAFGTSLVICGSGTVPTLPNLSSNGITGTWSPTVVSNTTSGVYTFTPTAGLCASPTTFTVTVNPNITPTFPFGTSTSFCAGTTAPPLPTTSSNGITGTWSPTTIDNQNSGNYTFTPTAGQCATTTALAVTVNPNIVPTFAFGTTLNLCAGGSVPTLPNTSDNGITGTWNPAVVDNQNSATYTFTPTAGLCATPATFTVTINPNIPPTFAFGSTLTICAGGTVPTLPNSSTNGITGTWNPTVVDNQNSGTYTFTPTAGQCALPATFTVTVNPNIVPTFAFGTSTSFCAGTTAPALPTTSSNGITGTWSPTTIDNQNSGNYTFTPTAGQCATTTALAVTVNPNIVPTFAFGTTLNLCAGGSVPTLPNTSDNGITGTWNPAVVDNQNSATYTFTPTAGLCATPATFTVTVNPNIVPAFAFGTSLSICAGGTVPALPNSSTNGIMGTWNPAVVDNQNSGTYTFTPTAGQCALPATFTVTVNPNLTPSFAFGTTLTICVNGTVPTLTNTSTNNITGTWNPAVVDNQNSGIYTFTPTAGQCALPATFTVTVNPNLTPTFNFGTSASICSGATAPVLPTTSNNGITGTWNPATVSNANSGTYTFTPTAGQCAVPATFTVTVNPNIVPAFPFGTSLSICAGDVAPVLPTTSTNGITGTWSPSIVDNQNSATYTFTPTVGQCATATEVDVIVNPIVTPTFNLGSNPTFCRGGIVPMLPNESINGIDGTWSPSVIDNQNSGTYIFTPEPGQCATTNSITVTISSIVTPVFSFGTSLTICAGGTVPVLPATSTNGIGGTWNPTTVSNQASGVYTFTPTTGLCATTATYTVTVNPNIVPVFGFGTTLSICEGGTVPALPNSSTNGITGTWSPATIDNMNSGVYTFTPTAGLCATTTALTVTVNTNVTPVFDFGPAATICAGATAPVLPTTASNGITGTWNPAIVDNQNNGVYTFTPTAGQCVLPAIVTFAVSVTPNLVPTFSFGNTLNICVGGTVPVLPTISDNGIPGSWTPSVVSNQANGIYTFTGTAGTCVTPYVYTVTVNPILTPAFAIGTFQSVCINATAPILVNTSTNGVPGTWNPAVVDNQISGTYTFTPDAGQCANPATFTYEVNPVPSVTIRSDTIVYDGAIVPGVDLNQTPGSVVTWTNTNPAIGLAASGNGNIPSFTAVNLGTTAISGTITVTPVINGCTGIVKTYIITVLPLDKDVFVPNVFSPNGDGKNDILFVYGNYITKVDMHIYNQWGQEIAVINNKSQGWDGRHKGSAQPVGVYVYVLKADLVDGRTINKKGSITLVR